MEADAGLVVVEPEVKSVDGLSVSVPDGLPQDSGSELGVFDKSIGLMVTFKRFGVTRRVVSSAIDVQDPLDPEASNVDKALLNVTKLLIDSKELREIVTEDGIFRQYILSRCLPFPLKAGIYLLPVALLQEVDAKLEEFKTLRGVLVQNFLVAYPALVKAAAARLGFLYSAADYPAVGSVARSFGLEHRYINFSVPGRLQSIDRKIFLREQERAREQWKVAVDEVKLALRAKVKEFVDHLQERLTGTYEDGRRAGKPKIIHKSYLEKFQDFLNVFDERNITNDQELGVLVQRMRDLVAGKNVEDIRTEDAVRDSLQAGFTQIKVQLDTMVVDRPNRAILIGED